jgi:LuxR family maltose regulon positive regulatory protein
MGISRKEGSGKIDSMEQTSSVLVNTKISVPRQRSRAIHRERLLNGISQQIDADIYLVHAPAGYGKTTLVLDWVECFRQEGAWISWYALDDSDNDKNVFAMYFLQCLCGMEGQARFDSLIIYLRSVTDVDLMWMMKSIINDLVDLERTTLIVLDDYHLIRNEEIHQAVSYFLEYLPDAAKVIISTRIVPPFPIARWQARARLYELSTNALKFKPDEIELFLSEVMHLQLSSDAISLITDQTEGWAAGLQLMAISLAGNPSPDDALQNFQGKHQLLLTYLIDEVFSHLSEDLQYFLLRTSIFPRFSAELCDSVLSYSVSSIELIGKIEQEHLFLVELDDQHTWFRYHHLFSSFLQSKLENEYPGESEILHRKASQWFKGREYFREAVQQAFFSLDWPYAAGLVCELGFYMIIHSEISLLYEWTIGFPEEIMQANPLLCILQSWALVYRYQKQNRLRIEARLHQAEQIIFEMDDTEETENLTEHLAVVRTFLAMSPDPDVKVYDYLDQALNMLTPYPAGHPGQYSALLTSGYAYLALQDVENAMAALTKARQTAFDGQLYFGFVEATFHLARLKHNCGELQEAKELCRSGIKELLTMLPNAEQILPALGSLYIAEGAVLVEENKTDEALAALQHGRELIGSGSNPYYLFVVYDALTKCSLYAGHSSQAYGYLNELKQQWPDISFYTQGFSLIIRSCFDVENDYAIEAKKWCDEISSVFIQRNFFPGLGPLGAAEVYYQTLICWLRLVALLDRFSEVRDYLQQMMQKVEAQHLLQRTLDLNLVEVLAEWVADEKVTATQRLNDIADNVLHHGFCNTFDMGQPIIDIVAFMSRKENLSTVSSVLYEFMNRKSTQKASNSMLQHSNRTIQQTELIEPLSDRELEIMQYIAQGMDNQQIADTLFITVGTVKSHVNHILRKLAARNRTEAVAVLRRSGLEI